MSEYLLNCSCGQKVSVSKRQAGHSVRCSCGNELEVPTLRALAELERADAGASPAATRAWNDRQRLAFVLAAGSLGIGLLAGYFAVRLPPMPEPPQLIEIDEHTPTGDVLGVYEDLKRGLDVPQPTLTPAGQQFVRRRALVMWGIGFLGVVAAAGAVAAVALALSGARKTQ
jgi:hypothetical protein